MLLLLRQCCMHWQILYEAAALLLQGRQRELTLTCAHAAPAARCAALPQAGGNSSAASCSICCEDYASGDVQRVLPCGHR